MRETQAGHTLLVERSFHNRADISLFCSGRPPKPPYSYAVSSSPLSPPAGRLSKELEKKIGHISKNNDMGCVCVPAIYQASPFDLLFLIMPTVIQSFTQNFHC